MIYYAFQRLLDTLMHEAITAMIYAMTLDMTHYMQVRRSAATAKI